MPMDFPDMASLKLCAECHNFRQPNENESEDDYRELLANHVQSRDFVESMEIRNKVGWDKFSPKQNLEMLVRRGIFNQL